MVYSGEQCSGIQGCAVVYYSVLLCSVLYCGLEGSTVVYSSVLWCTVVYSGVLRCTVCYEHKKVGKGDQIGRNSVLTTDRQTHTDRNLKCTCRAASSQLKTR